MASTNSRPLGYVCALKRAWCQLLNRAPMSQLKKVAVYDDCTELTCEQFVAVFGDDSSPIFFTALYASH